VLAVAERHGGRVEVGDAPGGGALFRVVLPATGAVDSAAGEASAAREAASRS
jgi:signal transduction histidine kinase